MLQPVRTKYRKAFKGRIHGKAARAVKLNYGQFGLKAVEPERSIGKQIEAARVALTRFMKRTGKVWTRIFPNILGNILVQTLPVLFINLVKATLAASICLPILLSGSTAFKPN